MRSQKALEVALSRLKGFEKAKVRDEQYLTPSSIAAEVLWKASWEDLRGKVSADLGSGTGILGIGALLLGAKKVYFVERDPEAMRVCRENLEKVSALHSGEAICLLQDIADFSERVDTALSNPPFGTREKHADRAFLLKALSSSGKCYTLHKTSTLPYLVELAQRHGARLVERLDFRFLLRNTLPHHTRAKRSIDVSCLIFSTERFLYPPPHPSTR